MKIDSRDLVGLPVVTKTGTVIGKVLSFEVDVDAHAIVAYIVGRRHWPGGAQHLIRPGQVIAITAEKMTVEDGSVEAKETELNRVAAPAANISPIATRTAK